MLVFGISRRILLVVRALLERESLIRKVDIQCLDQDKQNAELCPHDVFVLSPTLACCAFCNEHMLLSDYHRRADILTDLLITHKEHQSKAILLAHMIAGYIKHGDVPPIDFNIFVVPKLSFS